MGEPRTNKASGREQADRGSASSSRTTSPGQLDDDSRSGEPRLSAERLKEIELRWRNPTTESQEAVLDLLHDLRLERERAERLEQENAKLGYRILEVQRELLAEQEKEQGQ